MASTDTTLLMGVWPYYHTLPSRVLTLHLASSDTVPTGIGGKNNAITWIRVEIQVPDMVCADTMGEASLPPRGNLSISGEVSMSHYSLFMVEV